MFTVNHLGEILAYGNNKWVSSPSKGNRNIYSGDNHQCFVTAFALEPVFYRYNQNGFSPDICASFLATEPLIFCETHSCEPSCSALSWLVCDTSGNWPFCSFLLANAQMRKQRQKQVAWTFEANLVMLKREPARRSQCPRHHGAPHLP